MAGTSLRTVESIVSQQPYDLEIAQRLEEAQLAVDGLKAYFLADRGEQLKLEGQADVAEGKKQKENRLRSVPRQPAADSRSS